MFKTLAVATAVAGLALVTVAPAQARTVNPAMSVTHGAYSQTTGGLRCAAPVIGGNPGGRIFVRVSATETRANGSAFNGDTVATQLHTQKLIDGVWRNAYAAPAENGHEGNAVRGGGGRIQVAHMKWDFAPKQSNPFFEEDVPTSGLYRVIVTTDIWNQDGILLTTLQTHEESCNFEG